MKDDLTFKEIKYINSEENRSDNQKEISELVKILEDKKQESLKEYKRDIFSMTIGKFELSCDTGLGIFPFDHNWYLYIKEEPYSDLELYGPYSTQEAALLSIQTFYFSEGYGIEYRRVPEYKVFYK